MSELIVIAMVLMFCAGFAIVIKDIVTHDENRLTNTGKRR